MDRDATQQGLVVGVLGGTGQVGSAAVAELARRGHRPIAISRTAPATGEHRRADVTTGEGLEAALADADVVVDALNRRGGVILDGVRRALGAAREAGARHWVELSIVGSERIPMTYSRAKVEQEAMVRDSAIPWSIIRATQLHDLLELLFASAGRVGVLPVLRVPVQPVAAADVAAVVADRIETGPSHDVTEIAGPRVERLDELARAWARARGVRRLPLPVPAVGSTLRAVRDGALIDPAAPRGSVTFDAWLREAA